MSSFKRIFTFGCSFTRYWWSSWADIIKFDLDIPLYNFGFPGIGNEAILSYITYANSKYKFNDDDLIVVQWTSPFRHDYVSDEDDIGEHNRGIFKTSGNVVNNKDFFTDDYRERYYSDIDCTTKTLSYINCATNAYNINCHLSMTDPSKFLTFPSYYTMLNTELILTLSKNLPKLHYMYSDYDSINDIIWNGFGSPADAHPDILMHLNMVKNYIYPEIGLKINQKTIDHFESEQEKFVKFIKNKDTKNLEWEGWKEILRNYWGQTAWKTGFPLF